MEYALGGFVRGLDPIPNRDPAAIRGAKKKSPQSALGSFYSPDAIEVAQRVLRNGSGPSRDGGIDRPARPEKVGKFAVDDATDIVGRLQGDLGLAAAAQERGEQDLSFGSASFEHAG
jgi:hypothetical protein